MNAGSRGAPVLRSDWVWIGEELPDLLPPGPTPPSYVELWPGLAAERIVPWSWRRWLGRWGAVALAAHRRQHRARCMGLRVPTPLGHWDDGAGGWLFRSPRSGASVDAALARAPSSERTQLLRALARELGRLSWLGWTHQKPHEALWWDGADVWVEQVFRWNPSQRIDACVVQRTVRALDLKPLEAARLARRALAPRWDATPRFRACWSAGPGKRPFGRTAPEVASGP